MNKEKAERYIKTIESLEVVDSYEDQNITHLRKNEEGYPVKVFAYFEIEAEEDEEDFTEYVIETDKYYYELSCYKEDREIYGARYLKSKMDEYLEECLPEIKLIL